jgi:hypothetical protein
MQTIRDEVQKSPIKPPTITPKYDSNSMSTVLEWHVSFISIEDIVVEIEKKFSRAKKMFA